MATRCRPVTTKHSLCLMQEQAETKGFLLSVFSLPADCLWNQEEWRRDRGGGEEERGGGDSFLLFWSGLESMCCNKLLSSHLHPRFLLEIQSVWVLVDLLGIHHAAVEPFVLLSAFWRGWIRRSGDERCWVSSGLWMGLVYSFKSDCNPPHWSIDTPTATEGSCCTAHTQNRL